MSMLRAHQMERRRSGMGFARGENAKTWESSPSRLAKMTAMNTAMKSSRSVMPGTAKKLYVSTLWITPIATAASTATRNERIPAITAAARASERV